MSNLGQSQGKQAPASAPKSVEEFGSGTYADHVGARLLDFFADSSPWQRRLWDSGTVLSLQELAEAAEWSANGVLSAGSVAWLAKDLERLAGRDRAIGERELRQQLTATLRVSLSTGSRHHRKLRQLTEMVNDGYVDRWLAAVDGNSVPAPERLSRAVASHLLDAGYSMGHLHRWARGLIVSGASIRDLLVEASDFSRRSDRRYEVLVPFQSIPGSGTDLTESQTNWLTASQVANWLAANVGDPVGIRQNGGFVYSIQAKDPQAAVTKASITIERLVARSSLARSLGGRPNPESQVWVSGETAKYTLRSPARGTYVLSLVSESRLYEVVQRTSLDDALELAAALNHGSPGPAVAGGWAAIEALLVSSSDVDDVRDGRGVTAADRMASLVACSWPRAELTGLAYRHRPASPDTLSARIESATTNQERARTVAAAIFSGASLELKSASDIAAEARMQKLLDNPRATLGDVESHVRGTLRRLYRQRNIVMHGGATDALALGVSLRTAAPLVGAGLDRISHASLSNGMEPLNLAARASLQLKLVGGPDGAHVVDLLE